MQLLKESNKSIRVVEAEAIMARGGYVFLDGDGFKEWAGVVGEAAVYSRQQPRITPLNTPKEVLNAIRECDNDTPPLPPESELVRDIFKQLAAIPATERTPKITTARSTRQS